MIIPEKWIENLKNNLITVDMMNAALCSVNQMAKEYKESKDHRDEEQKCYEKKAKLLSYLEPAYIHIRHVGYENGERVYENDKHFDDKLASALCNGEICEPIGDIKRNGDLRFFDTMNFNRENVQYYLYYALGYCYYYQPINKECVEEYKKKYNLSVLRITGTVVRRVQTDDICDMSFVDDVIAVLESGGAVLHLPNYQDDLIEDYDDAGYRNEDEIDKLMSDNIEYGLGKWGEYLTEKLKNKFKDCFVDLSIPSEEQRKMVLQIEEEYAKDLEARVQNAAKNDKARLNSYKKRLSELSDLNCQGRRKKIRRAKKALAHIGVIEYKPALPYWYQSEVDFLEDLLASCDDNPNPYGAFGGIGAIDDLEEYYDEWVNCCGNESNRQYVEKIRFNYFQKHINELSAKYFGDIQEEAKTLLQQYELLSMN